MHDFEYPSYEFYQSAAVAAIRPTTTSIASVAVLATPSVTLSPSKDAYIQVRLLNVVDCAMWTVRMKCVVWPQIAYSLYDTVEMYRVYYRIYYFANYKLKCIFFKSHSNTLRQLYVTEFIFRFLKHEISYTNQLKTN